MKSVHRKDSYVEKKTCRYGFVLRYDTVALGGILPGANYALSSDGETRMLSNEISGDRAFEHIRWLSHWHRDSGMEGYFKAAEYVVKAAREVGLTDVRFIEQHLSGVNYTARGAELWMVEPVELKLADIDEHAVYLADGSHDTVKDYFDKRDKVRFRSNLHGLMRDEVFSFVDGQRSYYDIYKAVYAEAAAAGSWYYGTVTLNDVTGLLDAAVEAQALSLK